MDIRRKLVVGAVALAALGGLGSTAAMAASKAPAKAPSSVEAPGESQGETSGESQGVSDGPGGHADAAGNVDYQFNGEQ